MSIFSYYLSFMYFAIHLPLAVLSYGLMLAYWHSWDVKLWSPEKPPYRARTDTREIVLPLVFGCLLPVIGVCIMFVVLLLTQFGKAGLKFRLTDEDYAPPSEGSL